MTLDQIINQQIANWNVLYSKLHRFHWYVKGPYFFTLHAKFEDFYNEAADIIDELAERSLIIGGQPISTLKQYIEMATLEENLLDLTAEEMVKTLIDDYSLIVYDLKLGMEAAEQNDDQVTCDLFLSIVEKLEKQIWSLKSFLNA